MGTVDVVVGIALLSIFYGLCVSIFLPYFPSVADGQLYIFTDGQGISKIATMQQGLQTGMQAQTQIPFTEFGSLIFFSSIGAFNLFMNILTAVPQMLTILVNGLMMVIHIPPAIFNVISIGFLGIFTVLFYLAMFVFLISSRSPTYGGIK
jgi:hypothetical protein